MAGRTSQYYKTHPEARAKRLEYQAEYNKRADQLKKRIELNRENRKRGTFGDKKIILALRKHYQKI